MKACINHKCFYHVDVVIRDDVAYCKDGLQNRLKFMPQHSDILHGTFCPTCAQAGMIYIAKKIGNELDKERQYRALPLWHKILTFIKSMSV